MDFVYKRAQPGNPDGPAFDTTKIVFPKNDDLSPEDIQINDDIRAQLEALLPEHAQELPYNKELFPGEIVLIGIVHRRVINKLIRGEPLEAKVFPKQAKPAPKPNQVDDVKPSEGHL